MIKLNKMPKLIGDRLIVKFNDIKIGTGLIAPDSVKYDYYVGKIYAIGSGRISSNGTVIPMEMKLGDEVLVPAVAKLNNKPFNIEGMDGEFYLFTKDLVIGVM